MSTKIKNIELVTLALYRAGGASKSVDTEDVAVTADKIDNQRFKWKKNEYKKFIDRGLVFDSLKAAHLRKKGSFLKGNDDKGWILTSLGLEFCKNAKIKFNRSIVSKKRITKSEKNFLSREEDRILHSSAFDKFYNNKVKDITEEDIKFLFKVDDYTSRSDVEKRIINMLDNFKNKESVYKLINKYKEEVVNYVK
jgi:hypothetical protein|tara:strand:- start:2293 stop:2877 length:585 start_codon:yes stop_codon:yes gene_type:complete